LALSRSRTFLFLTQSRTSRPGKNPDIDFLLARFTDNNLKDKISLEIPGSVASGRATGNYACEKSREGDRIIERSAKIIPHVNVLRDLHGSFPGKDAFCYGLPVVYLQPEWYTFAPKVSENPANLRRTHLNFLFAEP
jgi:hypothetical protein